MIRLFRLLAAFIFVGVFSACGTDTGNPGFGPGSPASGTGGSAFMVNAMCTKLAACYPSLTYGNCYSGVFAATGVTSAMGSTAAGYATLNDAYAAVSNGSIKVVQAKLDLCSNAISSLSCGVAPVTNSYSVSMPTNFNSTYHLLSSSSACQEAVTPP